VELTHLKAFVAVAREGNLTRAAAQLNLSQPAVSLQIKKLQEMLGLTLFSRSSHGLTLTYDGLKLLSHVQRAVATVEEVRRTALALRNETGGTLTIGTILDPAFLRLGGFLKGLVATFPRIETTLRHGMSGWVLDQVRSRKLDVGYFIEGAQDHGDPHFHSIRLTQFQYLVLAPAGWQDRIEKAAPHRSWHELAALPWIVTPPASAHYRLLSRIFSEAGVTQFKVAEVDLEPSMIDLVKSGVGVSLARNTTALAEAHAHGLTIIEGVSVSALLTFVALAERREEPSIAAALQLVKDQWR
jgi:DNA-binding transcriptional LysR family regulator